MAWSSATQLYNGHQPKMHGDTTNPSNQRISPSTKARVRKRMLGKSLNSKVPWNKGKHQNLYNPSGGGTLPQSPQKSLHWVWQNIIQDA